MTNEGLDILPVFEREKIIMAPDWSLADKPAIGSNVSVLIVLDNTLIDEQDRTQLEKIMQACGLTAASYLIVTTERPWLYYRHLLQLKTILLFGVRETDWGVNIILPYHKIVKFDSRVWISTVSIRELAHNQQAKAELWNSALKPHFVLP